MTDRRVAENDGDAIGPDGTVRLRCYLPHARIHWFSVGCCGPRGCQRIVPLGVHAAIALMGTGEATVGDLERRLRCSACGGRDVQIQIAADPRPPNVQERDGPCPRRGREELPHDHFPLGERRVRDLP